MNIIASEFKTYQFNDYVESGLNSWKDNLLNLESYISKEDLSLSEDNVKHIISVMVGLKYNIGFNIEEKYFNLQRIGKLNNKITLKIVQDNLSKLSRIGLEKKSFVGGYA